MFGCLYERGKKMTLELNTTQQLILMNALHQYILGVKTLEAKAAAQGFTRIKASNYGVDIAEDLLKQIKAL